MTEICSPYDLRYFIKRNIEITQALWKTLKAVLLLRKATARDVSKITGRPPSIESHYLLRLNYLGLVARRRINKKVYYIEAETAVKEALEEMGDIQPEYLAHLIRLPADVVKMIVEKRCIEW